MLKKEPMLMETPREIDYDCLQVGCMDLVDGAE